SPSPSRDGGYQRDGGYHETPFSIAPRPRPETTYGFTRKTKTGCGNLYVTINYDSNNRPFELFSTMGKAGGCAASQAEAISRLISFALRSGAAVKEIIKQLKGISCHSVAWGKSGKILSCADAIGKAMEHCLERLSSDVTLTDDETKAQTSALIHSERDETITADQPEQTTITALLRKGACPDCGGILSYEEGCVVCHGCAYSECG
ncbi:MAG: TSCPD domain-containing protein, partial [Planctomycetota bacterium]|nr:TSCPD domain-containing protein [Planctomycetota bacterium]